MDIFPVYIALLIGHVARCTLSSKDNLSSEILSKSEATYFFHFTKGIHV